MKEVYYVNGMSCASCKAHVEKAALSVKGVTECSVNLITGTISVEGDFSFSDIKLSIESAGYGVSKESPKLEKSSKIRIKKLIFSFIALSVLFYVNMSYMMNWFYLPDFFRENSKAVGIVELVLSLLIIIINRNFYISGVKGLLKLSPNMDSLVLLGSVSSFTYSTVLLVIEFFKESAENPTYWFETAGMILTFISIGKLLESRSKDKAKNAIEGLYSLTPEVSNVYENGEIVPKFTKDIEKGEILIIKPGERASLDGIVVSGASSFDESSVTGESMPVLKNLGDKVIAGTVNTYGAVNVKVTETFGNTTIDKMSKLVEDVSNSKAPISRVADKVAAVFVPTVMGISLVTFVLWEIFDGSIGNALSRAVSVLVVSCPCALGLATPVAIVCGVANGAKRGILFKNAESLEICGKIKTACFDKTGTITSGHMEIDNIFPEDGFTKEDVLLGASICEKLVKHPISDGILRNSTFSIDESKISDFKTFPGKGVGLTYDGIQYLAGNELFVLGTENINSSQTSVFVKKDGEYLGYITLRDIIRPDAKELIEFLNSENINTIILTGDNEKVAKEIGKQVGAGEVYSKLLPRDKLNLINRFKEKGKVMMVGDGINDAPSLVASDIGIAIGEGTDIAIDSSDVVIAGKSLKEVGFAVKLSKKTIKIIYENLIWAFGYNIIGIPLAAGLFGLFTDFYLSPSFCSLCMSFSSFLVVTNSLRLLSFDKKEKKVKKMVTTIVEVKGMMCPKCEKHVNDAVKTNFNVISCESNHEKNETIIMSESPLDENALRKVISEEDYEVGNIVVK